tara:strand:+ start:650 stop:769 length:120 start_codon:yes stop_codon:yes gene_type:complete
MSSFELLSVGSLREDVAVGTGRVGVVEMGVLVAGAVGST